jgi:diguanylate cyclase (GGDEF)-like protein
MKNPGSGELDSTSIARSANRRAIDAERSDSDADQAGADADQAASDQDQAAADQDQADAASDQGAAERYQTSARQHHACVAGGGDLEAYEALRVARDKSTASRLSTQVTRTRTARLRAQTADERDASGAARDETAQRRNVREEATERSTASSDSPLVKRLGQVRARAGAASARATAARARAASGEGRAAQDQADATRERARLEAELLSARLDDLTGAFRREMGRLQLSQEIDRARRADGRFVIAFVDVDGMKLVNDRDGHAAGDHVLQVLVWTLRSNLRSFDPIVRYGGDEFVCGLGGVDHDVVARRFDVICRSVESDVGVGISVGLATLSADETLDQLMGRADADLLTAKKRRGKQRGA